MKCGISPVTLDRTFAISYVNTPYCLSLSLAWLLPSAPSREFVIVLEPYVQLEEEFVECFLTSPRSTTYTNFFYSKRDDWFKMVHVEGSLLAILQEVSPCMYCNMCGLLVGRHTWCVCMWRGVCLPSCRKHGQLVNLTWDTISSPLIGQFGHVTRNMHRDCSHTFY